MRNKIGRMTAMENLYQQDHARQIDDEYGKECTDQIDEDAMTEAIREALENLDARNATVRSIRTFAEEGVLTNNHGLALSLYDGSEYQITIIKSR